MSENTDKPKVTMAAGCWSLLFMFLLVHLIGMVIVWYAWNLGVVGMVAAAGGSVDPINLGTALGGSLLIALVRRMLGANEIVPEVDDLKD